MLTPVAVKCVGVSVFLVRCITVGSISSLITVSWKYYYLLYLSLVCVLRKW